MPVLFGQHGELFVWVNLHRMQISVGGWLRAVRETSLDVLIKLLPLASAKNPPFHVGSDHHYGKVG